MVFSGFRSALVAVAVIIFATPAWLEAIPAFSKKYEIACASCHSSFSTLNEFGDKFKINGWQMPDSEDGGATAKLPLAQNLFLDVGKANPPLSVILDGGLTLIQPGAGKDGDQNKSFFCCVDGSFATLDAGGTIAPNIGYWLSLPWGQENMAQGYLRFANWFGPGYVNVDIGAMSVIDYDAAGSGRDWFNAPSLAFHSNPSVSAGEEIGLTASHNDTGLRIYGRPMMGSLSYEVGVYTGAQLIGAGEDDADHAYTFMGRMDVEGLAISLRYWGNRTGRMDKTVSLPDGSSVTFPADRLNTDENTQELIFSASYRHPQFLIDLAVDRTTLAFGSRSAGGHTFSQNTVNRLGASVGAVWLINSWLETGIAYGYATHEDYARTVDGVTSTIKAIQAGLAQWKIEIRPVANMRVGAEIWVDTSSADARLRADGTTYDAQNKVLLNWAMAL
ncbi:MAG: hypothetical protein HQK86_08310 [Nitrospinae bacterium]|nr:hypothetical protein [Nitrospinota bacterium]MBF0634609.1 hypothetical protein [Nitrospinota bacterium]